MNIENKFFKAIENHNLTDYELNELKGFIEQGLIDIKEDDHYFLDKSFNHRNIRFFKMLISFIEDKEIRKEFFLASVQLRNYEFADLLYEEEYKFISEDEIENMAFSKNIKEYLSHI